MDRLWTPWRMAYITGEARADGCVFCDLPALEPGRDRESLIVARGDLAYAILNKFPYNSGHVMIAAYRHVADYDALTANEHAEIATWTSRVIVALRAAYSPEGFNVGANLGRAAGAGIVDHMHVHVVPRWTGDTNYMTTVGETKVLPETLDDTWAKLAPLLRS